MGPWGRQGRVSGWAEGCVCGDGLRCALRSELVGGLGDWSSLRSELVGGVGDWSWLGMVWGCRCEGSKERVSTWPSGDRQFRFPFI